MEKSIESYFRKEAKKHGALALKFKSPGHNGVPDRIVLFKTGRVEFVELKRSGEKLRPLQRVTKKRLESYNQTVTVIDSEEAVDAYWRDRRDR